MWKGSRPERTVSIPESQWQDLNEKIDHLTDKIDTLKAAGLETPASGGPGLETPGQQQNDSGLEMPGGPQTDPGLEIPGQEKHTCPSCDKSMRTKGETLGNLLNDLIDAKVDDDTTRSEIIEDMAEAAGIDTGTVNNILSGDLDSPPIERLEGFAGVLEVDVDCLVDAVEKDGYAYDEKSRDADVLAGISLPKEDELSLDDVKVLLEKTEAGSLSKVDEQVNALMDEEMLQLTGRLPD